MKLFAVSLSALLIAAGMAAAAPAEAAGDATADIVEIFPRMESSIQKRGYGCGVFSDDVGVCNFHLLSLLHGEQDVNEAHCSPSVSTTLRRIVVVVA
ncbi:MAG: hypothetical protein M1830_000274 [Pleopsidium flavum]|nr:MAG: hypothetical protein M1830_001160 [Pleopsidium flavum]KAI9878658.1 MAG: hypothetical protein M1830_000274 [Pleopsidium flavum]